MAVREFNRSYLSSYPPELFKPICSHDMTLREMLAAKGLREGAGFVVIGSYIYERWALEEMQRLSRKSSGYLR